MIPVEKKDEWALEELMQHSAETMDVNTPAASIATLLMEGAASLSTALRAYAPQTTTVWTAPDAKVAAGRPYGVPVEIARCLVLALRLAALECVDIHRALDLWVSYEKESGQLDLGVLSTDQFIEHFRNAGLAVQEVAK